MVQSLGGFYFDELVANYNDKNLEPFLKKMHIHILGYGRRQTKQALKKIEDFSVPAFLLVCYEQGAVSLTHAGQTTDLAPGSLYLFRPFARFSGTRTSKEPLTFKYIYFDIAPFSSRSIFINYAFAKTSAAFQQPWYRTTGAELVKNAYNASERKCPGWHFMLYHAVYGIVAYTMYQNTVQITGKELQDQNSSMTIIDQAFTYTAQHLSEPINIGELVSAIGTSRTTLDRVFKDITQMSPMQALTRYKIREALLLLQTGNSMKETAQALGYSSSGHLSSTFKKVFGISPRNYLNT